MTEQATPPAAELVCAFVNTFDIEARTDDLADPPALGRWLAAHDLGSGTPTATDLAAAVQLRERLRDALGRDPQQPADRLADLGHDYPLRLVLTAAEPDLAPAADGVDAALAGIVAAVVRCGLDGSWARVKVCSAHGCRWAFYDHTRNRSRTWCAMRTCGNREKTRSYRDRRRDPGEATTLPAPDPAGSVRARATPSTVRRRAR